MSIQRYSFSTQQPDRDRERGDFVRYKDYLKELAAVKGKTMTSINQLASEIAGAVQSYGGDDLIGEIESVIKSLTEPARIADTPEKITSERIKQIRERTAMCIKIGEDEMIVTSSELLQICELALKATEVT